MLAIKVQERFRTIPKLQRLFSSFYLFYTTRNTNIWCSTLFVSFPHLFTPLSKRITYEPIWCQVRAVITNKPTWYQVRAVDTQKIILKVSLLNGPYNIRIQSGLQYEPPTHNLFALPKKTNFLRFQNLPFNSFFSTSLSLILSIFLKKRELN